MRTKYNKAIEILMQDDKNGTWDEILQENKYDYKEATEDLTRCIERAISELNVTGDIEIIEFYESVLNIVK
ncbi:MAG: hypothetical protein ACRC3Y_14655 [Romboutsia sp.]|uniref:hypothetical protein n=1 Tax=Romboutsia sp. TaxID=1965302 RepID=UPI003F2CC400